MALSRHAQMPRNLLLELNAEATDYLPVDDQREDPLLAHWEHVRMGLEDAPKKFTRQEILGDWPPDLARPSSTALWQWLDRAVKLGLVSCDGKGRKYSPFRC